MKKILAVIFLLISGLLIFLATVDLETYLAPDQPDIPENVTSAPTSGTSDAPSVTTAIDQVERQSAGISAEKQAVTQLKSEDPQDNLENFLLVKVKSATTVGPTTAEPEQAATQSAEKVDDLTDGKKPGQEPSSLLELEVKVLPPGEYPFSILLETFLDPQTAQLAIPFYQKRGIPAYWVKVDLGEEGIRYRLFTGVFKTVSEAQQYLDQNQLIDKLIKRTYYSARLGVYMDKAQLAGDFVKTIKTGVIPYILGTKKGDYFLYVGAFYTFIGATAQCHELIEAGLSCESVKRSTIRP